MTALSRVEQAALEAAVEDGAIADSNPDRALVQGAERGWLAARDYYGNDDAEVAYLKGRFEMCKLLSTSPRFNKPQIEIIKEQAHKERERLEARGVKFTEGTL